MDNDKKTELNQNDIININQNLRLDTLSIKHDVLLAMIELEKQRNNIFELKLKAAELKYPGYEEMVGEMYEKGEDVEMNLERAAYFYLKDSKNCREKLFSLFFIAFETYTFEYINT